MGWLDEREQLADLALDGTVYHEDVPRLCALVRDLGESLDALLHWAQTMPDAGFNDQSPRWNWWHERPQFVERILNTYREATA